jgi:hypothetical protein
MTHPKASLPALLAQLPRPPSADWPEGEPFVDAMRHGTMSLEIFAPRGTDHQGPHTQDDSTSSPPALRASIMLAPSPRSPPATRSSSQPATRTVSSI